MIRRHTESTLTATLFPYPTRFRSERGRQGDARDARQGRRRAGSEKAGAAETLDLGRTRRARAAAGRRRLFSALMRRQPTDADWMAAAVALAWRGRGPSAPNPNEIGKAHV